MSKDDQRTVGASEDLLAEVQAWVSQDKAEPEAAVWRPPVTPAPVESPVEAATQPRKHLPPPSAEDVWRDPDDLNWRPPGRLAGAADTPVPTPPDHRGKPLALMVAIGVAGALLGGALVWVLTEGGSTPPADDAPNGETQADDDSQLGG